jgi:hypothetical protein
VKLGFLKHILEKYSNIKFPENSLGVSLDILCGRTDVQTDRHDEANGCFSHLCKRAYKLLSGIFPFLDIFDNLSH